MSDLLKQIESLEAEAKTYFDRFPQMVRLVPRALSEANERILILCKALGRAVSALKYAEEDQCDRYYTNVREEIESIFEEPALIAMAKEVQDEPEIDFDFGDKK